VLVGALVVALLLAGADRFLRITAGSAATQQSRT
jgi:hypothetical protein